MPLDPVELLRQLIQIPSVNPMGRDVSGPPFGEQRLTDFLQNQCEQLGLPWLRQRVHAGRDNLVALVRGHPVPNEGGEFLLWEVHQDTVPVEGMTIEPFGGEVRNGRVYGRGTCDVKGGMATMLAAISRVVSADRSPDKAPTIVLAFTVNEESGYTGARALGELWAHHTSTAEIVGGALTPTEMFPVPLDAAVVVEPTNFQVVVAHQGIVRWRCRTIGRATHTSRPDAGINAIYGMVQIVQAIERYHAELQQSARSHPLCGSPTACVSTIQGGVGVNTVPECAMIEIERRLGPEERPADAYRELVEYVAANADVGRCSVEHEAPFLESCGLDDKFNRAWGDRLATLVRENHVGCELIGVPYGTDAPAIASEGVPTVVFGPGSIDQAHTADEFISIEDLKLGAKVFYQIARNGLSGRSESKLTTESYMR
jgi:acetylornithine deacetylase/succinyl-diaminopimelate desuccinylase-like protein